MCYVSRFGILLTKNNSVFCGVLKLLSFVVSGFNFLNVYIYVLQLKYTNKTH